jgi:hypothetical protein
VVQEIEHMICCLPNEAFCATACTALQLSSTSTTTKVSAHLMV